MKTATADAPRRVVVDASVAAKWLLPEHGSDAALALLREPGISLHAPELWPAELLNVLWKRKRRGEVTGAEAVEHAGRVAHMPVRIHGHAPLLSAALLLALRHDVTVYDALYVALARSIGGTVVTADTLLLRAGTGETWPVEPLEPPGPAATGERITPARA